MLLHWRLFSRWTWDVFTCVCTHLWKTRERRQEKDGDNGKKSENRLTYQSKQRRLRQAGRESAPMTTMWGKPQKATKQAERVWGECGMYPGLCKPCTLTIVELSRLWCEPAMNSMNNNTKMNKAENTQATEEFKGRKSNDKSKKMAHYKCAKREEWMPHTCKREAMLLLLGKWQILKHIHCKQMARGRAFMQRVGHLRWSQERYLTVTPYAKEQSAWWRHLTYRALLLVKEQ